MPEDEHDDRAQEETIAAQGGVIPTVPLSRSRKRAKGEGLLILQERHQPRAFVPMGASQKLAAEAAPAGRPPADPPYKQLISKAIPDHASCAARFSGLIVRKQHQSGSFLDQALPSRPGTTGKTGG